MLYHLSTNDSLDFMFPRIPESAADGYEDTSTARICVSNSINGCLNGLEVRVPGDVFNDSMVGTKATIINHGTYPIAQKMAMTADEISFENVKYLIDHPEATIHSLPYPLYHVYVPVLDTRYTGEIVEKAPVFDQSITGEYWITVAIKVVRIGKVIVFSSDRMPDVRKRLLNGRYEMIRSYQFNYHFVQPDHELPHEKFLRCYQVKKDN